MLPLLFLLFTLMPVFELYLLFRAGAVIGALPTLGLVILTGAVGALMARSQGRQILFDMQRRLERGEVPEYQMMAGLMVFVGGVLLLTPGFITDVIGLSMIFPVTRYFMIRFLTQRMAAAVRSGNVHFRVYRGGPMNENSEPPPSRPAGPRVIDVKKVEETD